MLTEQLVDMIAVTSFSLGLFGAALCALQSRDVWPFRVLALVLLASCAMELEGIPWPIMDPVTQARYEAVTELAWLLGLTAIAPLFWHYVVSLTSVTPRLPNRPRVHFVIPGIALMLTCAAAFMSEAALLGLFVDDYPLPTGWPLWVGIAGELLILAAIIQWGVYVAAIVRALLRYRKRLKQYVASTTQVELGWVWLVITAFSAYWMISATDAIVELTSDGSLVPPLVDSLLGLTLLVIILLWGLRQRPGLSPNVAPIETSQQKYERSALTADMADRLERKLRRAMTEDHLHHDPNLSLWTLARHTGASPNYVSQTLNDQIGDSFFDFVNGYRIADAQGLLEDPDRTVLSIAFDVGFNSRSSFYTAFKKVTGHTPSAYRRSLS